MRSLWRIKAFSLRAPDSGHFVMPRTGNSPKKSVSLSCILLAGIALGSIYSSIADNNRYISYFVHQYLIECHSGGLASVSASAFLSAMTLQIIALFFSLSCIGAPILLCIPFLRGVAIGCISAYLYIEFGYRGLLANLILLWIPEVLQAGFLILFVSVALDASINLFRLVFLSQTVAEILPKLRRCLRYFIVSSMGMLLASLLEGLLSAIFAPVLLSQVI